MTDPAEWAASGWGPEPEPAPGGLGHYRALLRLKHNRYLVTPRRRGCAGFTPRAADKGDHVVIYCDDCGVVVDRVARGTDTDADGGMTISPGVAREPTGAGGDR